MKKSGLFVLICLLGMSTSFAQAEFYKPGTTVPDNKDEMIGKAETFLNAVFEGNVESVADMLHEDYYQFPPGTGKDSLNKEASLKNASEFSNNWKNASWKGISTCVKDENSGNTIVFLWGNASASNAESGKEVAFMNHSVYVFKDDKIFRVYQYYDTATPARQMGMKLVPADE